MPSVIAAVGQLPAASRVTGYDKKLRMRAMLRDIFVNSQGLYNAKDQQITNSIYMKVDETANQGATDIRITMKKPVVGLPQTGNTRLLGTEVPPETISGTLYRNNYKFAVNTENYNTRNLEQKNYGLFEQHIKDLGDHAQQFEGMQIRQALCQRYPDDMNADDVSVVQRVNPHVFVQGAADSDQPVYSDTAATFEDAIVDAIITVGALGTQPQAGAANFRMINKIALTALSKKLMPLDIGGNQAYILTLSPTSASIFSDPTVSSSMGAVWTDYNRLSDKVQNWHGLLGKFATTIGVDVYIAIDHKCPTILPTGGGPYGVSFGYIQPGDVDARNLGDVDTRDVGILLGKGALVNWEPEKLHMVKHEDDYGRIQGTGYAGTRGIQMLTFDQAAPSDTSIEYYGSMLCIMNRWTGY